MMKTEFRAWDKIDKAMSDPFTLEEMYQAGVMMLRKTKSQEDYEIMQFTGLLDKNGKKIFKGDVLLVPDIYHEAILDDGTGPDYDENHLSEVVFKECAFGVEIKERAEYLEIGFYPFCQLECEIGLDGLEVIGNKFENPELLKEHLK